nr:hypothetical protein [Tanacetum cinerariifolium]
EQVQRGGRTEFYCHNPPEDRSNSSLVLPILMISIVLNNKKDERGIVIRNKVRLVAQGHTQEEGIDYDEVFAPVARIKAIRLFLAYASFIGFTMYQMDVKSAFFMGTIDQILFIKRQRGDFILVQVYVDDVIFGSLNPQLCREFEDLMHEKFQMSAMASPTPTLRIHKDHPKSQIISHMDTPIQTRNKSKEVKEQSFIATIHQKTDPALL